MKNNSISEYFKNAFPSDLSSGLVVFLVAIPLCLGIAVASEAPPMSGIIAGIAGGIIVGIFGGSALGVSGPAAGLLAVVVGAKDALGTFEAVLLATVIAGVFQLALGKLKAGIVAYYIPNTVIKGMLAAIGLIIILKQIPHAVGYDAPPEGELGLISADGHNTFSDLLYMLSGIQWGAVIITAVGLAILIMWNLKVFQKYKFFQLVPGPFVVVVVGIILEVLFTGSGGSLALTPEHLVQIPTGGGYEDLVSLPDFNAISNIDVWVYALIIAAVASVESLLCAEATDKMDPQKRITPMNRELSAQGLANIVSGMIGGLPVTQVIVRSSANVQSGAKTRGSALVHGILILAAVLLFPSVLNMVPLAALAAILLMVGFKLTRPALYMLMFKKGWTQFIPFIVTVIAIMFTDLLVGIGIGLGVAIFLILRTNFRLPFSYRYEQIGDSHRIKITLSEIVSFINKGQIMSTLQMIPENSEVEIDGRNAKIIDPDVKEVFQDFIQAAQYKNIKVNVYGLEDADLKKGSVSSLRKEIHKDGKAAKPQKPPKDSK